MTVAACAAMAPVSMAGTGVASAATTESVMVIGKTSVLLDSVTTEFSQSPVKATVTIFDNGSAALRAFIEELSLDVGGRLLPAVDIYQTSSGQGTDFLLSPAQVLRVSLDIQTRTYSVEFAAATVSTCTGAVFSLTGNQGLNILQTGYPASALYTCSSTAPTDAIEQTVTAGASSLSYDPATDQYTYVWKTDKAWAGTCRALVVKLADGATHTANFEFTK